MTMPPGAKMGSLKWLGALVGLVAVVWGAFSACDTSGAQVAPAAPATSVSLHQSGGEVTEDVKPSISFIESPSATCYNLAAGTGACYIVWDHLAVTAGAGSYIITMTLAIDDRLRAYYSGFFQTGMYIPAGMHGSGFRVSCGAPQSGGVVGLGSRHTYTIRARESSGLAAANYGTVYCPPDMVHIYAPSLKKLRRGPSRTMLMLLAR